MTNDALAFRVPFSRIKIEIDYHDDTQLYGVYLKPFRRLVWEASTQDEAASIAEDFRKWGIEMNACQDQDNVIKANKMACRLVIVGYIIAVVILFGILVLRSRIMRDKLLEGLDLKTAILIVKVIIGFLFLSILPLGLYLCRFGWRAIVHRQIPPPGTVVLVDTKIIKGKRAVTQGKIIVILSFALIGASLIGGFYFPHRLEKVLMEQVNSGTTQPQPDDSGGSE